MKNIKWIDDIANATKFWSLRLLAAITFMTTIYLSLPKDMVEKLPPEFVLIMNVLMAIAAGIGRVLKQDLSPVSKPYEEDYQHHESDYQADQDFDSDDGASKHG